MPAVTEEKDVFPFGGFHLCLLDPRFVVCFVPS